MEALSEPHSSDTIGRMSNNTYIGRYAPSPTGDLHLGNLRTALVAWLHARLRGGRFLLRMEDLDTPRVVDGSADAILRDLEWLGLDWDGEVVYQSQRQELYQSALEDLGIKGLVYECFCSRKDIQQAVSAPHTAGSIYPGTCRALDEEQIAAKQHKHPALRIRVADQLIVFDDACLGHQQSRLSETVGDFVIKRADGLFAYQLAVVVDDLEQSVSHVVRGADLADSTARQIYLAQTLAPNFNAINYCHVPLMLDEYGARMAKRDGSESIRSWREENAKLHDSAEGLIAQLAFSIGLPSIDEGLSARDLLNSIDLDQLMRALRKPQVDDVR